MKARRAEQYRWLDTDRLADDPRTRIIVCCGSGPGPFGLIGHGRQLGVSAVA